MDVAHLALRVAQNGALRRNAPQVEAGAAAFRSLQMVIAEGRMFETREAEAPGTLPPAGNRRDSIRT